MKPDNTTSGAELDATHVIAPGATETVENGTQAGTADNAIPLSELNQLLGKNFPSKEAALKSLKDTASYVGMKTEDIEKQLLARTSGSTNEETTKLASQIETLRKDMFYKDNPQYADANVRALIDKLGTSPSEVVASPEFKAVFEKAKGFDDSQKLRTVLDSNPRLATSRDALTKAVEMRKAGASTDAISDLVAEAVLGTLDK